jgi:hypothetical protein
LGREWIVSVRIPLANLTITPVNEQLHAFALSRLAGRVDRIRLRLMMGGIALRALP